MVTTTAKRAIPVDTYLASEDQRRNADDGIEHAVSRIVKRRIALQLPSELSLDTWQRIGEQIAVLANSSSWWLGDWLLHGRYAYPDRYQQALAAMRLDYQTLRNYTWVCSRVDVSRRREKLSFQHHVEVAALPPAEQDLWLDRAVRLGWSRNVLRQQVRQGRDALSAPCVALRIVATPGQQQRWQSAADRADQTLTEWIGAVLNKAAQ
jgi:hypothetical protein